MGLDQYLTKKIYIGGNYEHNQVKGTIRITKGGKKIPFDINKIKYIEEEAAYWRKANQIHKWFVDNVQDGSDDCKEYYVSRKQLEELLSLCKRIKGKCLLVDGEVNNGYTFDEGGNRVAIKEEGKVMINPGLAEELLPTGGGFFFGSTDYDEYYMSDIEETIVMLTAALKDDRDVSFYYSSSW